MAEGNNMWKEHIIQQIRERNRIEIDCFADLISYNNKLVEGTTSLHDENLKLTIENDKLRKDCREGGGNSSDLKKIQGLEQKLLHQQEELTSLHKRRGEHTQQIVDLNSALQERDKMVTERDAKINEQNDLISSLNVELTLYRSNFKELQGLNQTIRDEHTALQLAYAALEDKLRQVENENCALLDGIMKYTSKDVKNKVISGNEYVFM